MADIIGVGGHSILGGLTQAARKPKIQKVPENLPNFELLLHQELSGEGCIAMCLKSSEHPILVLSWQI